MNPCLQVTSQSKGDRNFHIFYQFLSGIESEDERKQLRLLEPTKYRWHDPNSNHVHAVLLRRVFRPITSDCPGAGL